MECHWGSWQSIYDYKKYFDRIGWFGRFHNRNNDVIEKYNQSSGRTLNIAIFLFNNEIIIMIVILVHKQPVSQQSKQKQIY